MTDHLSLSFCTVTKGDLLELSASLEWDVAEQATGSYVVRSDKPLYGDMEVVVKKDDAILWRSPLRLMPQAGISHPFVDENDDSYLYLTKKVIRKEDLVIPSELYEVFLMDGDEQVIEVPLLVEREELAEEDILESGEELSVSADSDSAEQEFSEEAAAAISEQEELQLLKDGDFELPEGSIYGYGAINGETASVTPVFETEASDLVQGAEEEAGTGSDEMPEIHFYGETDVNTLEKPAAAEGEIDSASTEDPADVETDALGLEDRAYVETDSVGLEERADLETDAATLEEPAEMDGEYDVPALGESLGTDGEIDAAAVEESAVLDDEKAEEAAVAGGSTEEVMAETSLDEEQSGQQTEEEGNAMEKTNSFFDMIKEYEEKKYFETANFFEELIADDEETVHAAKEIPDEGTTEVKALDFSWEREQMAAVFQLFAPGDDFQVKVGNVTTSSLDRDHYEILVEKIGSYYIAVVHEKNTRPCYVLVQGEPVHRFDDSIEAYWVWLKDKITKMFNIPADELDAWNSLFIIDSEDDINEELDVTSWKTRVDVISLLGENHSAVIDVQGDTIYAQLTFSDKQWISTLHQEVVTELGDELTVDEEIKDRLGQWLERFESVQPVYAGYGSFPELGLQEKEGPFVSLVWLLTDLQK